MISYREIIGFKFFKLFCSFYIHSNFHFLIILIALYSQVDRGSYSPLPLSLCLFLLNSPSHALNKLYTIPVEWLVPQGKGMAPHGHPSHLTIPGSIKHLGFFL